MAVSYQELKSERQWRSSTGLKESQFKILVGHFAEAYEQIFGESLPERKSNSSQESVFKTYEELLFFVLFSLKSGLTYDVLGFVFGLDGSNAQRNQKSALPVLRLALSRAGVMPARGFSSVKDFEAWFSADNAVQKESYSGKKKSHTVKALVISNPQKLIRYISRSYFGRAHDFGILKTEFPPQKTWFQRFKIRLDLGFLGFEDLYPCEQFYLPNKKPKKQELSEEQKAENKAQASERVAAEHSIAGLKRYRFLSHRLHAHDPKLYDLVLGVCAGLWNFSLLN